MFQPVDEADDDGPVDDSAPINLANIDDPEALAALASGNIRAEDLIDQEEEGSEEEGEEGEEEEDEEEEEEEDEEDEDEEEEEEEDPLAFLEEDPMAGMTEEEKRLSKSCLRIGDVVYVSRYFIPPNARVQAALSPLGKPMGPRKKRYILFSSGIGNKEVVGIPASKWIYSSHLGLFRIETTMGSTQLPETATPGERLLEERANKEGYAKSQGDLVKYGQQVQLRHVHSGSLLSLDLLVAAQTPGAWKVITDDNETLCSKMTLTPFNRLQSIGDPINYADAISLVFVTENLKYFLQSEYVKETRKLDINSTHKPVGWNFVRFQGADTKDEYVRYGWPLKIKYTKLAMEIAIRPKRDKEATKSTRELTAGIIKSEADMQRSAKTLRRAETVSNAEEVRMEKPDPLAFKIAAVKLVDDYSNFWVLQSPNYMRGGNMGWRNCFYIYNPKSEMYLGPNLSLVRTPTPDFLFQVMKPDSSSDRSFIPLNFPGIFRCLNMETFKNPKEGDKRTVLDVDRSTTNEEIFDRLIPANVLLREGEQVHKEISVVMDDMKTDSKEVLFQFEQVEEDQGIFYMQMSSVYNEFVDVAEIVDAYLAKRTCTDFNMMAAWQSTEDIEKHLRGMERCLVKIMSKLKLPQTMDDYGEKQAIIAGLNIPSVLLHICSKLSFIFRDLAKGVAIPTNMSAHSIAEPLTENKLERLSLHVFTEIMSFLNEVVLDNLTASRVLSKHQSMLCQLLSYDTKNIGLLLTEVFRLVDPDIKDPKTYFHEWCNRLDTLTEQNCREQTIYMRIIRNLCEIGETGLVEYQREITGHLFSSDITFHVIYLGELEGEPYVSFGYKGDPMDIEVFYELNPKLEALAKTLPNGQTVYLIKDMTDQENYMTYIQSAIMLYACICRGPFTAAREACESKLGISPSVVLSIATNANIHLRIREACLYLIEGLVVSLPPHEQISATNHCYHYSDIQAQQIAMTYPDLIVIDCKVHSDDINKCLKLMFELWLKPTLAQDIAKWSEELRLRYLKGALYLVASLIEYNHTNNLYWGLIMKALSFCLAGLGDLADQYKDKHWIVGFMKNMKEKSLKGDLRLKHFLSEFFSKVMSTLISLWKISRKGRILKLLNICLLNQESFVRTSLLQKILKTKLPEEVLSKVNYVINMDSNDKELLELVRRQEKSRIIQSAQSFNILTSLITKHMKLEIYTPNFDFKDIVTQAPEVKDIVLRAILNWEDFSDEQKVEIGDLMHEMFKDQKLVHKALLSSDVISMGPVAQTYGRMKWLKNYSDLPSLIIKAKYEAILLGNSVSLNRITLLLEYVVNLMHPRLISHTFHQEITQNIIRHMEIHKQFFTLWKLLFYMDRIGKGQDSPILRCKAALSNFLYFFQLNHHINRGELNKMMRPKHNFTNIIQHALLIQHLNGYAHMGLNEVTRMFESILYSKLGEKHGYNSLFFIVSNMISTDGNPNMEIQNVASSQLSENLSRLLKAGYKSDKAKFASLLELLGVAAFSNLPVVIESRSLLSYSTVSDMMLRESDFNVLMSIMIFLFYAYFHKVAGIKSIESPEEALDVIEYVVGKADEVAQHPEELIQLCIDGAYYRVFLHNNPAHTDNMQNLPTAHTVTALKWKFFSYTFFDVMVTGALRFVPSVLENLARLNPLIEYIEGFYKTLTILRLKVLHIAKQTENLINFSILLQDIERCRERLRRAVTAKDCPLTFPADESFDVLLDYYEVTPQDLKALHEVLDKKMEFQLANMSQEALKQDKHINEVVDSFASGFSTAVTDTADHRAEFVQAIVTRIDQKLTSGEPISKKEAKSMIPQISKKVRRLENLFSAPKQRVLFFRIVDGIVPNEELGLSKIYLNPVFMETQVVERAIESVLKYESVDEMNCALEFLSKLFLAQSKEFMIDILKLLDSKSMAYYLFVRIENEITATKRQILGNFKSESGRMIAKSTASTRLVGAMVQHETTRFMTATKQEQLLINMFRFMQKCCDNCNEAFQSYFRNQKGSEGKPDINLLECVSDFLIDIRVAGDFLLQSRGTNEIIASAMNCMIDLVTGPNKYNQQNLGKNVKVYLAMNKLLAVTQTLVSEENANIHESCIQFLLCLLEGIPDSEIAKTMGKFLDIGLLRTGCEAIFNKYIRGQEESYCLELPSIEGAAREEVEAAMLQAVLLLKLKSTGITNEELTKFDSATLDPNHYYTFYLKYIGYVELDRDGVIENHYFPVPWRCKYLTPMTKQKIITDVSRNSQLKKIEDFLNFVPLCNEEMRHQQFLSRYPRFKKYTAKSAVYNKLAFTCIVFINFVLLDQISDIQFLSLRDDLLLMTFVTLLGFGQLLFYFASFMSFQIEYYPNLKRAQEDKEEDVELDEFYEYKDGDAQVMRDLWGMMDKADAGDYHVVLGDRILKNMMDVNIIYNYLYITCAIIALYEPVFYPFMLLDIIKQTPELMNILRSITKNYRQLLLTSCLGGILIYLFSIISFIHFNQYYNGENNLYSDSLLDTFISTFNLGIRCGGGIADVLDPPEGEQYWVRMLFDLCFYLFIIIILLNIIFGIIIDTFSELRMKRQELIDEINGVCYICGTSRSDIDMHGYGWSYHFMCEHSPFAYLAFFMYLGDKKAYDCNGLEKQVKEKQLVKDYTFMPSSSILLQSSKEE